MKERGGWIRKWRRFSMVGVVMKIMTIGEVVGPDDKPVEIWKCLVKDGSGLFIKVVSQFWRMKGSRVELY